MSMTAPWWQYVVVAMIVLASALQVFRKVAPRLAARGQGALAAVLNRPGRPVPLRRLGQWLRPREATGQCGDGCGTCGTCGTTAAPSPAEARVTFHPQRRPAGDKRSRASGGDGG